jgi:excisionase family DNA binding protein
MRREHQEQHGLSDMGALSIRELAKRWHIAPGKLRRWIRDGKVRAFDVGEGRSHVLISMDEIRECERERFAIRPPAPRRRRETIDPEIFALLQ